MAEVTTELSLKIERLQSGLEKARSEMATFKRHAATEGQGVGAAFFKGFESSGLKQGVLALIGGGTLIGAFEGIHHLTEEYARLYDLSKRFDASPESMQRLSNTAEFAGTNIESL